MDTRAFVRWTAAAVGMALVPLGPALGQDGENGEDETPTLGAGTFSAIKARSIGPALMSGRIGDIAVNPNDHSEYYVAVSSGNLWKTTNKGTTFEPVFENEGSYSIGCVAIDPSNPSVVWVGSGENNSQRSVSFGDGVYKSVDGGKNWENVGLETSEHIGMIAIHPENTDVVYVASQGPLWNSGGERGLFRTMDGGETWDLILDISEDTGVNEVHLDPRNPDIVYASAYQRRRHVWTLINGGPESGLWKSTDGGETWREINKGLPGVDKGRIGLDISPANPDVLYAIVEASDGKGGFYRSVDRGETWERRSDKVSTSPQYYNELVCHPTDAGTVFCLDTRTAVSRDGGRTWTNIGNENRHVDDHALWIDPADPRHMVIGGDGGLYETWDADGESEPTWEFKANLPVTQFYRVSVDNSEPFYYVYGGTQDNNSQGGPSRTNDRAGITNADWFITVGGDGYETVIDPEDPMTLYAQWQYGGLVRYDRRSGEVRDIKPMEAPGQEAFVFNWDTPLILSPHDNETLYYAANYLIRSTDRGDSWEVISDNLTRGIDRNELEIMGVIQKPEAVAKHDSTSIYGNAVSLDESPIEEGLIYVGTDDGLIHVTEDGGENWRTIESEDVPGVPEMTYVSSITASVHDADRVFASFENKKMGDFTPYLFRSDDRGETWVDISGDLPDRHICYTLREDHEEEDLLFLGTEFAAMFSLNGGEKWHKVSGLPTIAVRDIEIQRREGDLVLGTFGRSFYVVDDYSPMRHMTEDMLDEQAVLFPVKAAPRYAQKNRLGSSNGKGSQGNAYYAAANPPFGATFTYYLGEKFTTLREDRMDAQKEDDWEYPSMDDFQAEAREREPAVFLTIRDENENVVRRVKASRSKGMHRTTWDLQYPSVGPISAPGEYKWDTGDGGALAPAGTYTVTLEVENDGEHRVLAGPEEFEVYDLGLATFGSDDQEEDLAFMQRAGELYRAVMGASRVAGEASERLRALHQAAMQTPGAGPEHLETIDELRLRLHELVVAMSGDPTVSAQDRAQPPSLMQRVSKAVSNGWYGNTTQPVSGMQREQYGYAAAQFTELLPELRTLIEEDLAELEAKMEGLGAPWTPGRLPTWRGEF